MNTLEMVLQTGGEFSVPVFLNEMFNLKRIVWTPMDSDVDYTMLTALLEESIYQAVWDKKKIAVLLSGGVDSSLILALINKVCPSADVTAFHTDFGVPERSEIQYAQKAAAHLRTNLEIINTSVEAQIPYIEESLAAMKTISYSAAPVYMAFEKIKDAGYDIAVNALGLDELMAGYTIHRRYFNRKAGILPYALWRRQKFRGLASMFGTDKAFMLSNMFLDAKPLVKFSCISRGDVYKSMKERTLWDTIQRWTLKSMVDNFATLIMRGAAANGVEVLFPYMNHSLMHYCLSMQPQKKFNKKPIRWLMRHNYEFPDSLASRGEAWDKIGWGGTPLPYFENYEFMKIIGTNNLRASHHFTDHALIKYFQKKNRVALQMMLFLKIEELVQ